MFEIDHQHGRELHVRERIGSCAETCTSNEDGQFKYPNYDSWKIIRFYYPMVKVKQDTYGKQLRRPYLWFTCGRSQPPARSQ
ncbi:hypothetical protein KIN20_034736 [Parelaphostrongylus tenuis]|uniref:Uncharacterized protein n=1 Tax=Parelaphostrongylus tenuis TaxID=148309 RepID=A0AAD5RD31_PARTN|nr:hypothetical protein KIN20_034736 [Parelaphostrongylus tenuis]